MEATDIVELLSRLEQKDKYIKGDQQYYQWGNLALEKIEKLLHLIETKENIQVD